MLHRLSLMARAVTGAAHFPICPTTLKYNAPSIHSSGFLHFTNTPHDVLLSSKSYLFGRTLHVLSRSGAKHLSAFGGVRSEQRGYRKSKKRTPKTKQKDLELSVDICIEEDLPDDDEILVHPTSNFCLFWLKIVTLVIV